MRRPRAAPARVDRRARHRGSRTGTAREHGSSLGPDPDTARKTTAASNERGWQSQPGLRGFNGLLPPHRHRAVLCWTVRYATSLSPSQQHARSFGIGSDRFDRIQQVRPRTQIHDDQTNNHPPAHPFRLTPAHAASLQLPGGAWGRSRSVAFVYRPTGKTKAAPPGGTRALREIPQICRARAPNARAVLFILARFEPGTALLYGSRAQPRTPILSSLPTSCEVMRFAACVCPLR
jgi:hypothetical protein